MSTAAKPKPGASSSEGVHHKPYVPDNTTMPEFTWSAVLLGAVLGIVFGASSLYLVLKVGMTVSASIPVAVLSITLFRAFSRLFGMRRATILENNIVQTTGSAGESIAFGVGVTMPAVMLLGFDMDVVRVLVVAVLGGLLGILMMIPLRRAFIVRLHGRPGEPGKLLYPEGTACAQVLISGEKGGTSGAVVFFGFGIAFLHKILTEGMNLLSITVAWPLTFFNRAAVVASEMATELLGVGYIIGTRTASIMMAGAVLGYLVIAPIIATFGDQVRGVVAPATDKPISEMSIRDLRENYILFIGAGCVATAGIISMFRTMPLILRSIGSGLGSLRGGEGRSGKPRRTEDDMPLSYVVIGCLGLLALLVLFLMTEVPWIAAVAGALLVLGFGFLFVTVSSRLTGEIGSSSNPISGMTVATLLMTSLIFLGLGWTSPMDRLLALSIGAVVCIAASNGGTTSQDLKTGFLVGGTPRLQQWAIIIGALTSAVLIGGTLLLFNAAGTIYSSQPQNLPRLNLRDRNLQDLPQTTYQGTNYYVWRPREDELPAARAEAYLVDQSGRVAFLVDPAIMGKLERKDDGTERTFIFEAPKTQVMAIIIKGVLGQRLKWDLVLIGAMIAITLELCGISSLPFAVGVYIPIQFSAPIFLGGLVRWGVDAMARRSESRRGAGTGDMDPERRAREEVAAIARSESSPGVLLASGFIAGGSLAGVCIAFLNFPFAAGLQNWLNRTNALEGTWWAKNIWIPSLVVFALFILVLALVGWGRLFRPPPDERTGS